MTYDEKRNWLQRLGVDFCVEEAFNASFASTSAQDFFEEILLKRVHARVIVVGDNFYFGKNREGNIQVLRQFCESSGVVLEAMSPIEWKGAPVSSSRIRQALGSGDVELAAELLGRPFFYRAEIVHGDKRGRLLGFPTANMKCEPKFPLKAGVYATTVIWRNQTYRGITNLGTRPTFDSTELKMETHLIGEEFDLYGEMLEVLFHERIRDEKKFASVQELKSQIEADTLLAEKILSHRNF
jgi:riboflavin kinase/FMN adenylyltransferase